MCAFKRSRTPLQLNVLGLVRELHPLHGTNFGPEERATGPWPDRMQRNASRAKMVGAGWMTATARADIGVRFGARSKSVGLGLRTDV